MNLAASRMLEYFAMMHGCMATLPEDEKVALETWEQENLDGATLSTSDWPGWVKYIGPKPLPNETEKSDEGFVYLLEAQTGIFKIGSSKNVARRVAQLQTASPFPLTLRHYFAAKNARKVELELHSHFVSRRIRNEWFQLNSQEITSICQIK
jgi:predicted GIY-YIG superfamily endonuclease